MKKTNKINGVQLDSDDRVIIVIRNGLKIGICIYAFSKKMPPNLGAQIDVGFKSMREAESFFNDNGIAFYKYSTKEL